MHLSAPRCEGFTTRRTWSSRWRRRSPGGSTSSTPRDRSWPGRLWLAKSRIIDHYRQQARQRRLFSEGLLDRLAAALVSQQAEMPARQAALERCLERLPEKSRRLLTLRYAEDASVAEVATAVAIHAGTEGQGYEGVQGTLDLGA